MKKRVITLICISAFSLAAQAQTQKEDIAIAQSIFGKTKKTIINEYVRISDEKKSAFWGLYDQYEEKSNAISRDRLGIIKQYADSYQTLDDEVANKLAEELLDNSERYNKLYKEYLKKFKKEIGGLKAATLIQIELYIQTAIQANLQSQIPVIGELDKLQN
ncbi:hypothetical protein Dfri01_46430 [Dyadobacter frigoris]|uniref:hypothetical protein n=1 Tax=Dyadobacter frigoris TaxID=2576211 RepID=UPI0024A4474D|nr:hypothetical protein [Dyadobacter frigoris]GLU55182.1 hypothetical protein Dfri01_46430 [Dyadobacter frigoris]